MRLKKLILQNFKGIHSFEFSPNGKSANIYGENATGKTSIADAVTWLLFDKDTQDRSPATFGIKTVDENGEPLHGEEHTVEGRFELEGGERVTLRKIYKEKWTTRRGSSESELTGHTTDYYWDDEPINKGEYEDRIADIMPEQMFKMLTTPNYFAEVMHWTDRREILTEICGHIQDNDVIDGHPELNGYPELLDGKSQQAREKILRERKKKLNDELNSIPDRIDENQQKITDPDPSRQEANKSIEILKERLEGKREKLTEIKQGGGVAELKQKVQEIQAEESKYLNEHRKKVDESLKDQREKVSELEDKVDEVASEYREAVRDYQDAKTDVEAAQEAAKQIADDIQSASEMQPESKKDDGPDTCPYCKQEMPKEDHEDHYEDYLKQFNQDKAEKLKELKADLQQAETILVDLNETLKEKEQKGAQIKARKEQREKALEKAKAELDRMKSEAPEPDTSEFNEKRRALTEKIDELKRSRQSAIDEVQDEIEEIENHIEEHQKVIREHDNNTQYRDRIKELKEMLKKYGKNLNEVEQGLHMIEDFNRAKSNMITERVNELFDIVSWRLFKEQVNGGMSEVCDPVVNGVPYSEGLNNAARIQAGIDIINTLSRFYGKTAPVFCDNRESVTELPDTDLQVISLIVSPQDKRLRVETSEKELAVA